jgi:hypothetical protein
MTFGLDDRDGAFAAPRPQHGPVAAVPRPGVAEPQGRQQVERGRHRAPVVHGDPDQDVVGRGLGILHLDVEVLVAVEDAGLQ